MLDKTKFKPSSPGLCRGPMNSISLHCSPNHPSPNTPNTPGWNQNQTEILFLTDPGEKLAHPWCLTKPRYSGSAFHLHWFLLKSVSPSSLPVWAHLCSPGEFSRLHPSLQSMFRSGIAHLGVLIKGGLQFRAAKFGKFGNDQGKGSAWALLSTAGGKCELWPCCGHPEMIQGSKQEQPLIPGKENRAGSWLQWQELVLELVLQILGETSSLIWHK